LIGIGTFEKVLKLTEESLRRKDGFVLVLGVNDQTTLRCLADLNAEKKILAMSLITHNTIMLWAPHCCKKSSNCLAVIIPGYL
jgi:hypothetical protein